MEKCIFCKLKYSDKILLENKFFYSIFDQNPVGVGHILIIPKRHIIDIEELNSEEKNIFFDFQKQVFQKLKTINLRENYEDLYKNVNNKYSKKLINDVLKKDLENIEIKDYNLGVNNGIYAGRTVNHLHFHIIPRFKGDVDDYIGGVRHIISDKGNYKNNKKLVRDKIPEIIEKKGEKAEFYIAGDLKYKDELFKKLLEETKEIIEEKDNKSKLKEELGDLFEVFETILKLEKIDFSEIIEIKNKKGEKNGKFNKRIILKI